jgi:hypothetical protein
MTTIPMLRSGYEQYMKTTPKLAAMRIGAFTCFVDGACTYPLLDYGACTYPLFDYGACTLPPCQNLVLCTSTKKKSQSQRGLCCAFEYYEVDGVLSYNAVLVAVLCRGLVTVSRVGFWHLHLTGIIVTFIHSFIHLS